MGNVLDKAIPEDEAQPNLLPTPTGCAYCSEKVRLVSFKQLKPGDHICQGGRSFIRHLGRNEKYLYTHHSIVKDVICVNGTDHSALITLIHYNTAPYDRDLKVQETSETRDLRLNELYIVRYRYPGFQPNQVLDRAQKALENDHEDSPPFLNSEHFCTWCITGEEFSCKAERAMEIMKNIVDFVLGAGSKIAKLIMQFVGITADDVANAVENLCSNTLRINQVATIIPGVVLIMYLIRNIVKQAILHNKFKKGQICKRCYNFEARRSWYSFIAFCVPNIASILTGLFITGSGLLAGILVPLSILSLAIVWGSTKAYKTAKSPFRGDKTRVHDMWNFQEGDVIQYRYWNMMHEAVVSSVDYRIGCKVGKVHVIHYGLQALVSKREIVEEELTIDLNEMEIFKLDYSSYTVYPPEEVVRRARHRVGERKFGVFTNRSCHFCHWAKVNESFDTVSTLDQSKYPSFDLADFPHQISTNQSANRSSTPLIDKTWIKIKSEVRGGDPIQFNYHGHWHKGICTEVHSTETARELKIKVVHYSYQGPFDIPEVREETFSFDLSVENVYIYHYHPAHRYSRTKIVDRARKKIGEKKYSMLYRNSGHLVEEIILRDKEEVINSPSELSEGDIVSFSYWGIRHRAILVSIAKIPSDKKCWMNVIHYAARSLVAKRTVVEENLSIDLAGNNLRKVNFQEYFTYPGYIVIERARKRLGEQNFHPMSNNSSNLVHWAKVDTQSIDIQFVLKGTKMSILLDTPDENQNQTSIQQASQIMSLNDISGKGKGQMYMEPVRSWEEFLPGHIVEFKYYCISHHGILTEVNPRHEKIKVVHYGTKHILGKRTILEDDLKVNLKKENFYIYHPDPEYAYTPEKVIKNAKSRLGEQKWGPGNRSYDFCRACFLRESNQN
ncbi:hypothetical protein CHS0354_041007 [Potamilus streckersoni]|uniref:LRAT domain-containing protein n=1 Tax=Potamilus streckersoni TaxID=2493646 RepID=A0AAE0SVU8_9BIVA|nr:hypothetical protein CHS0354_041007 [Potamilus streckersoni]